MSKKHDTILIVEDEPALAKLTQRVLSDAGYETILAGTGAEGLQLARTTAPDLVLLDVVLPDIDGVQLCGQIKESPGVSQPHVIMISGARTGPEEQALGLDSGADGYIARPITNRELLARVEAMLRLRRMEEKVRQQENLAVVGQLASGLAHNLNSILQSMLLRAEMAQQDPELPARAERSLEQLVLDTTRAARLVQKLLDFSRQTVMQPQAVQLPALVTETVKTLDKELPPKIQSKLALASQDAVVWGDAAQLRQLLQNLARNAVDAMAEGGELLVSLRREHAAAVCTVCDESIEGEWLQLVVRDEGGGIPQEVQAHMFEPFFGTHLPRRQGLGLSQAMGIVKQHEGHLTVESRVGRGTTVTVYLPPFTGSDPAT